MNEDAVRSWLKKAESDLKIGTDEIETVNPATDAVCFHAQQCCEKYLKAFLVFHGEEIPRTHNLAAIVDRCMKIDAGFEGLIELGVDKLTDYAVNVRYAEEFYEPSLDETRKALMVAEVVKEFTLQKLREDGFVTRFPCWPQSRS